MRLIDETAYQRKIAKIPMEERTFVRAWETAQNMPTIDAVPVVRGEWVVDECDTTDDVPSFSWIDFHCSECNTDYGLEEGQYGWCSYEKIPYKYCPNCGAKMESEGST